MTHPLNLMNQPGRGTKVYYLKTAERTEREEGGFGPMFTSFTSKFETGILNTVDPTVLKN